MIKKIIYIGYQPLTVKVRDDFYLLIVQEQGFEIEYWDLHKIYFPDVQLSGIKAEYIFSVNNLIDLESRIANQSINQSLFISIITFEFRVIKLFLLLKKYNCQTAFFARGALPFAPTTSKSIFSKIKKSFNPKLLFAFLRNNYASYLKNKGKINNYDFVFNAGELGIQTIGIGYHTEKSKSKIFQINSFDFDKYIQNRDSVNLIDTKYCLFLDEYFPYHPDFKILGIETLEPIEYYNSLNRFFNLVETRFKIEVIIAAHPKADGYKTNNPFNGRKIFFNLTAELTKFAEFTIAHCSTSISFAVLNEKPVIFLYSDLLKSTMPSYFNLIANFSVIFGGALVNVNNFSVKDIVVPAIDQFKYADFKYKYLTSEESESRKSSDIFIEAISKL